MAPLNTKKLLKQCQKMSEAQKVAALPKQDFTPDPILIREEAPLNMTPVELEAYLTQFLQTARDAQRRYEEAVALEILPNESIQDLLHTAEFAPSLLKGYPLDETLHTLRAQRRTAKQELEVTDLFKAWSDENKAALNKLENLLGNIRKVLRRQPNDFYMYKTNIIGEKGKPLIVDPKESEDETVKV